MGQTVHGTLRQDRIVEQPDPFLDRTVAGPDRRGSPVTFDDDLVQVARLAGVEPAKAEIVDDQQIRREQAAHSLLARVIGQGLVEFLEHLVRAQEEHLVAGAAGGMAQTTGEQSLAHTHGAEEQDVLGAFEEAEVEQVTDAVAIEGHRRVPVEVFQRAHLFEAGLLQAQRQVLLFAPVDLILERQFQEVLEGQLGLPGIGYPVGQCSQHPRELQSLEHGFQ